MVKRVMIILLNLLVFLSIYRLRLKRWFSTKQSPHTVEITLCMVIHKVISTQKKNLEIIGGLFPSFFLLKANYGRFKCKISNKKVIIKLIIFPIFSVMFALENYREYSRPLHRENYL